MDRLSPFRTEVRGKWALLGEHAVLRGEPALVFPHPTQSLRFEFSPDPRLGRLEVEPSEAREVILELLHLALPRIQTESLFGRIRLESSIVSGGGFGSSAAISVAIARFSLRELDPAGAEVRALATRLEDRFHGKSSGMDVHAAALGEPILFRAGDPPQKLSFSRFPRFTFHDTGLRTQTHSMITQVESWRAQHPEKARDADSRMGSATRKALHALQAYSGGDRAALLPLSEAILEGRGIFSEWGLIPPEIEGLERSLRAEGALATKLTGAGGGGFLIALRPDSVL